MSAVPGRWKDMLDRAGAIAAWVRSAGLVMLLAGLAICVWDLAVPPPARMDEPLEDAAMGR